MPAQPVGDRSIATERAGRGATASLGPLPAVAANDPFGVPAPVRAKVAALLLLPLHVTEREVDRLPRALSPQRPGLCLMDGLWLCASEGKAHITVSKSHLWAFL